MQTETNIDILYQMAIDRLNDQFKRIDGADSKIGVTFGLTNGLAAALIAFITLCPSQLTTAVLIFAILSSLAYITTLILLFIAYRKSNWSFRPDVKTLRGICTSPEYQNYPEIVKKWVADECILSINRNNRLIAIKLRRAYRALVALSAQGLLLAASCVFYLLS